MSYVSKTWVDRQSEFPTRRKLIHTDLSEEQVTVMRDEGTVTTQGDVFDANTMNNLESRIAAGIAEKQDVLTAGTGIDITNNIISATGGGGGSSTLDGLDDVNISSPTNGQALVYDSSSSKWVNANGGSGSATLSGLTDVTLTNPTADQVLKYDGTKWVNGEGGGDVELSKTVSGSVCSFSDGADGLPVKDLVAQVVAVQSGTGDPSPSNARQISGFTGLNLKRCTKNLVDIASLATTNITYSNGVLTGTGLAFSQAYSNGFISVPTTGQITVTLTARTTDGTTSNNGLVVRFKYKDGTQASIFFANNTTTWETKTFTSSSARVVDYILFSYAYNSGNTWEIKDLQVELGTSSTTIESYSGNIYPVTWQTEAGTVYGCLVNPVTGVMKITHVKTTVNDMILYRTTSYTNPVFYANLTGRMLSSTFGMSDKLKYIGIKANAQTFAEDSADYDFAFNSRNEQIYIRADSYSDVTQLKEALGSTEIIYELATPVTVQLTPTEVTSLLGTNNIWHDANGDTTVTYYTSSASDIVDLVQYDTTKQDKLTAGTGITIDSNNVISATGGGGGGAAIDDTTTSTTSVWSSSKTNGEIEAKKAQILVPEYNEIHNYFAGEICIHEGVMYKASVATQGTWDSSKWVALSMMHYINEKVGDVIPNAEIGELLDVDVATAQDGQVLKYNSTSGAWENANESGGAQALNDLTDVSVASPTDGKVLTYRSIMNQWVASTPPVPWVELTATIPARQPSDPSGTTVHVLISDSSITTTKTFDIYVDTDGVYPLSKSVSQGVIDLEFEPQLTAVGLKVRVS